MSYPEFLNGILAPLGNSLRRMTAQRRALSERDIGELVDAIIGARAESATAALADDLLDRYEKFHGADKLAFFELLRDSFGISADAALAAAKAYSGNPNHENLRRLYAATEPSRQNLIRRLNHANEGTARLVRMRADLLQLLDKAPALREVDLDFNHLFQSWFSGGFLELRRIDWNTPASVLAKIIEYEAVHEIKGWDDLRGRIDPADRRLYAFFHPRLPRDPLVFIEVALAAEVPCNIADVIGADRESILPQDALVAVFYSISNCHDGLRGVSFGNLLIKQVVATLGRELPQLKTFVTLSPAPGFARWARSKPAAILDRLAEPGWEIGSQGLEIGEELRRLAAIYLLEAKDNSGAPLDPVARFHLGNGSRLERINWPGNLSPAGLESAFGIMVNYHYKLDRIEAWSEQFCNENKVITSPAIVALAARPATAG